jgi:hypothetical protein
MKRNTSAPRRKPNYRPKQKPRARPRKRPGERLKRRHAFVPKSSGRGKSRRLRLARVSRLRKRPRHKMLLRLHDWQRPHA